MRIIYVQMTELKHCLGLPESLEHLAILPSRLATEVPIESCDCATLYSGAFRQLDDNSHILVMPRCFQASCSRRTASESELLLSCTSSGDHVYLHCHFLLTFPSQTTDDIELSCR